MTDGVFLGFFSMKSEKSDRCIEELMEIAEITGITKDLGVEERKKALKTWVNRWIMEYNHDQPYIKTNFSEEEKDFIKYYSKYVIINELMEECVNIKDDKKRLKMKIRAIKTQ